MAKPKILKTKSGLPVIFYQAENYNTATVLVLVKTGTDFESKSINGISHLIEHVFFKGSKSYPTPLALSLELDKIGAEYNAFTSYELTGYYIKTIPEYCPRGVELLADMLTEPIFDQAELEKERKVVLEEINYNFDTPTRFIHDLNLRLIYGDQPAGWPILGPKETIARINQADILRYVQNHYSVKNTVVIVSGNFNQTKVLKTIEAKFQSYRKTAALERRPFVQKQKDFQKLTQLKKDLKQAHLLFSFRTDGLDRLKDRRYSLSLLAAVLGAGFSSRLFSLLRQELGATYYLSADTNIFSNRGYFYIQTGADLKRLKKIIEAIKDELVRIKVEKIDPAELEKAKTIIKNQISVATETSDTIGRFTGENYLFEKKIVLVKELIKKINQVNAEAVQKEAELTLRRQKTNVVLILPEPLDFNLNQTFANF